MSIFIGGANTAVLFEHIEELYFTQRPSEFHEGKTEIGWRAKRTGSDEWYADKIIVDNREPNRFAIDLLLDQMIKTLSLDLDDVQYAVKKEAEKIKQEEEHGDVDD